MRVKLVELTRDLLVSTVFAESHKYEGLGFVDIRYFGTNLHLP